MRCQLLKKDLFNLLLCFGLLSLNHVAVAQVYKSYDADGNVVFSDKPTQGSSEVEISKPNLSDSFEAPPSPQSAPAPEPEAESEPVPAIEPIADEDSADVNSADTNNDGRISRREKEEQRKERRRKKREEAAAAEGDQE